MACFKPVQAYKPLEGGSIVFSERKNTRSVQIPCGQCIGCRTDKKEAWALRNFCEAKMHAHSWFLTCTYDPLHLPMHGSLVPRHLSDFVRALRRPSRLGALRYFGCGEYGDTLGRPHLHLLIYGPDIPDLVRVNSYRAKGAIYSSAIVSDAWQGKGAVVIARGSLASMRYVAGYVTKKITGDLAEAHYSHVDDSTGEIVSLHPEFSRMSRNPGLGFPWLQKYWRDVYATGWDSIRADGQDRPVPKFFKEAMSRIPEADKAMQDADVRAAAFSVLGAADRTPERLAVREACLRARIAFNAERSR